MKISLLILLLSLNFSFAKTACMGAEGFADIFNVEENFGADLSSDITPPHLKYKGFLSPEDLRNYSANTISELLVDRIQEGCDKNRGGDEEKSVGENSEVMMMVNDYLYDSIDKYGFQNQHVTATTQGCDCRDVRYNAEMQMLGNNLGYSSKVKDVLPKYSGLNVLVKSHFYDKKKQNNGASGYGNTAVVFKKHIQERTTFTPWDSLGTRKFRDSPIFSSLNFKDNSDDSKKFKCSWSYCEAQIWGNVTLDDVAYVLIPKGKDVPEVFKKRGIPVYYKKDGNNGTMSWEKGKIAYQPEAVVEDYTPPAIPAVCEDCNSVTKKINDHHNYSKLNKDELIHELSTVGNIDQRREILGELAVKQFEGKKEFFEEKLNANKTSKVNSIIYMQALSEFPDSKALKDAVIANLDLGVSPGYGMQSLTMMAMSLAVELDVFRNDEEVQAKLTNFVDNTSNNYFKHFYQYLTTDKNMCDELEASSE